MKKINTSRKDLFILFVSAFLVTQFFFFIDEGYNDFRWMKSTGNWIVFIPYLAIIYSLHILVRYFTGSKISVWLSALVGFAATIALGIFLFTK